jgi:hypothetical protein
MCCDAARRNSTFWKFDKAKSHKGHDAEYDYDDDDDDDE